MTKNDKAQGVLELARARRSAPKRSCCLPRNGCVHILLFFLSKPHLQPSIFNPLKSLGTVEWLSGYEQRKQRPYATTSIRQIPEY